MLYMKLVIPSILLTSQDPLSKAKFLFFISSDETLINFFNNIIEYPTELR